MIPPPNATVLNAPSAFSTEDENELTLQYSSRYGWSNFGWPTGAKKKSTIDLKGPEGTGSAPEGAKPFSALSLLAFSAGVMGRPERQV